MLSLRDAVMVHHWKWGHDSGGTYGVGKQQETLVNCADITITASDGGSVMIEPPASPTQQPLFLPNLLQPLPRGFPRPSRLIHFDDVSKANERETPRQKQYANVHSMLQTAWELRDYSFLKNSCEYLRDQRILPTGFQRSSDCHS